MKFTVEIVLILIMLIINFPLVLLEALKDCIINHNLKFKDAIKNIYKDLGNHSTR